MLTVGDLFVVVFVGVVVTISVVVLSLSVSYPDAVDDGAANLLSSSPSSIGLVLGTGIGLSSE